MLTKQVELEKLSLRHIWNVDTTTLVTSQKSDNVIFCTNFHHKLYRSAQRSMSKMSSFSCYCTIPCLTLQITCFIRHLHSLSANTLH